MLGILPGFCPYLRLLRAVVFFDVKKGQDIVLTFFHILPRRMPKPKIQFGVTRWPIFFYFASFLGLPASKGRSK